MDTSSETSQEQNSSLPSASVHIHHKVHIKFILVCLLTVIILMVISFLAGSLLYPNLSISITHGLNTTATLSPNKTNSILPSLTIALQIFTNSPGGLTFKYPATWQILSNYLTDSGGIQYQAYHANLKTPEGYALQINAIGVSGAGGPPIGTDKVTKVVIDGVTFNKNYANSCLPDPTYDPSVSPTPLLLPAVNSSTCHQYFNAISYTLVDQNALKKPYQFFGDTIYQDEVAHQTRVISINFVLSKNISLTDPSFTSIDNQLDNLIQSMKYTAIENIPTSIRAM